MLPRSWVGISLEAEYLQHLSAQIQYPSVFIYCLNQHQFLILCSSKAMMFVKLYFRTSDIYLISLVSLDPSGFYLRTKLMPSIEKEPIYDVYCFSFHQYQRFLNILFWGWLSGAVGSVDVWCSASQPLEKNQYTTCTASVVINISAS